MDLLFARSVQVYLKCLISMLENPPCVLTEVTGMTEAHTSGRRMA